MILIVKFNHTECAGIIDRITEDQESNLNEYIMALDEGTTSTRAVIYDKNGNIISSAQKEFSQIYPKTGWVEQDPSEHVRIC